MPGKDPGGFIITILLGIAGAFIGTWIGRMFAGENYAAGWIMSIVGAMILLLLYRLIRISRCAVVITRRAAASTQPLDRRSPRQTPSLGIVGKRVCQSIRRRFRLNRSNASCSARECDMIIPSWPRQKKRW